MFLPAVVYYFSNSVTIQSLVNIRIFCHSFNFFSESFLQKITILLLILVLSFSPILTNFHLFFTQFLYQFSLRLYPIFSPFLSHFYTACPGVFCRGFFTIRHQWNSQYVKELFSGRDIFTFPPSPFFKLVPCSVH